MSLDGLGANDVPLVVTQTSNGLRGSLMREEMKTSGCELPLAADSSPMSAYSLCCVPVVLATRVFLPRAVGTLEGNLRKGRADGSSIR